MCRHRTKQPTRYERSRRKEEPASRSKQTLEGVETAQANLGDPDSKTPETALIAKADANCLKEAIAALPTAYRETLILRDIQGLSYRETAEVTGVPIGTVMSRLARARRRLIAILAKK
jgi:RNA polymerase sigma factor (sigma-70 family)